CSNYPDCDELVSVDERFLVRLFGKEYLRCEECGSEMELKYSQKSNTRFLGCSNYPDCKNTKSLMG
ncbi:MAG: topoisomerase DNA-binding C4 zinc finger domain-containing protein, partial [Candidatus Woesearchaeota archaeon]